MAKNAKKTVLPQVLTANDLLSGAVLYRTGRHSWSPKLVEAEVFIDPVLADQALEEADRGTDRSQIMDPYLMEVESVSVISPVRTRERIRAAGPSVVYGQPQLVAAQ